MSQVAAPTLSPMNLPPVLPGPGYQTAWEVLHRNTYCLGTMYQETPLAPLDLTKHPMGFNSRLLSPADVQIIGVTRLTTPRKTTSFDLRLSTPLQQIGLCITCFSWNALRTLIRAMYRVLSHSGHAYSSKLRRRGYRTECTLRLPEEPLNKILNTVLRYVSLIFS